MSVNGRTREYLRDMAQRHDESFKRLETIMEKQNDIMQKIADATLTLNHNSTSTLRVLEKLSEKAEENKDDCDKAKIVSSASTTNDKLFSLLKYTVVALVGVISALLATRV